MAASNNNLEASKYNYAEQVEKNKAIENQIQLEDQSSNQEWVSSYVLH